MHKKCTKHGACNYKPVSLTSVLGKTMDRIIKSRITLHLESNNLINDTQHGFRERRSCLTNLLDFFGRVTDIYDEEKAVDIVYLDFKKAFDKVPHERLLKKLEAHGIRGNLLRWIRVWLTTRKQRVMIDGIKSEWRGVTSGVPQGSVLGPLLFIIYINDLDTNITSKISKFADDTKICHKSTTYLDRIELQEDIDKLVEWANTWQMEFNAEKCTILHIGCHNRNYNFTIDNRNLTVVNKQRDLGIAINKDLKWKEHINNSIRKARNVIGFIGRNFHYKGKDIVLPLYKALVRPHLEFAVQLWSPHYHGDIEKMEKVQRKATKMIPCLRNKRYLERLEELELTTLEQRRLRGQLIETFKYLRGFTRANPAGLFDLDDNGRTRNNGQKLKIRASRTTIKQKFYPTTIVSSWNNLPANVVGANSVNTFKNRLDEYWTINAPTLQLAHT